MRPMLASQGTAIPHGPDWAHEVKWDGMRVLADVTAGRLRLLSRNENDVTARFPELGILAGPGMPEDMLLDGEVVSLDGGLPSFSDLAERMHVSDARKALTLSATRPVTFMVFDLLRLYGVDLTSRPLAERREALERIGLGGPNVQVPATYDDGDALYAATRAQGLEGVVSKRLSSTYNPGRRSRDWLKFAHRASMSVVTESAHRLGAVLVGTPTPQGLLYRGRVGSGLAGAEQERVLTALQDLSVDAPPFADKVPKMDAQGTTWVRPEVVVDVKALGVSTHGRLRQPAYRGLRPDLSPDDLQDNVQEEGRTRLPDREIDLTAVLVDGHRLRLSNLDKVMYPATETTKGEVLNYYARVAPFLLPHLADRPVTRIRWPHGTDGPSFFEKNLPPGAPSWLRCVAVPTSGSRSESGTDTIHYPVVDGAAALTYLVNLASLELHVTQWRFDADGQPRNPDRLVIDLDPGAPAGLHECAQLALLVRERLERIGLNTAPVTSGSKGMQLYAALPGEQDSGTICDVAREVAQQLTRLRPELVLWKMTKSLRPGKVLLDWSQNAAAKTTIAPYSLRGKEAPFVAAPRTWAEIERGAERRDFLTQLDMDDVLARVASDGDLFAATLGER
jgi:bifunctional non-homologous end joining protein LigD